MVVCFHHQNGQTLKEANIMTENTRIAYKNRISAFLFGNRIIISKETKITANLPILAGIIVCLFAIRLTVFAVIVTMFLGYRFSIVKYGSKSFDTAVQDATEKAKTAVHIATDKVKNSVETVSAQLKDVMENVKQEIKSGIDSWEGMEDHH